MNYIKVSREDMCYLEADDFEYHELMERLVLDELMVFYVMRNIMAQLSRQKFNIFIMN